MAKQWIWMSTILASLLAASCGEEIPKQEDCDPGFLKVDGKCEWAVGQECNSNGDCLANRCVKPTEEAGFCTISCVADEGCPTGFYCTYQTDKLCYPGTRPPPCQSDDECEPCEECAANGKCQVIPGCAICSNDDDCQSCQRCDQGICIDVAGCTPCTLHTDCPPCEVCSDRQCRRDLGCLLCSTDQDCPGCYNCLGGACTEVAGCGTDPCFNDGDCPTRTKCLPDAGLGHSVCMPSDLHFGADCSRGGDEVCGEGICLEQGGESTCTRSCAGDADCPSPTYCIPDADCLFLCREKVTLPPGDFCQSDAGCTGGKICGLVADAAGTGWESRCVDPQLCATDSGDACDLAAGDRCTSGICTQEGFCSPVCAADYDCPEGFLCDELQLPLPSGGDAPFLGCAPEDLVKGEVGEPCPNGDADCKSGLCLVEQPGGPHPFCSMECTPGAAECPDGFDCRQSPVDQRDLCQPSLTGGACDTDADCTSPEVCTVELISGTTVCIQPTPGGGLPGDTCTDLAPCANQLCLRQGFCGAMCTDPADCPAGFICDYVEFYLGNDNYAWTQMCTPDPGSMLPCERDADCLSGELCGLELNPWGTGLEGRCTASGPGGGPGTDCSQGYECANYFCTTEYFCTTLCVTDADCPQDYACFDVTVEDWMGGFHTVPGCVETGTVGLGNPCPHGDIDCQPGLFCYHADTESYCSKECTIDDDCRSTLRRPPLACLDDGSGNLYCLYP